MHYKFGKTPARPEAIKLRMAKYLELKDIKLPKRPMGPFGHGHSIREADWGMGANDKYGCCLAEGTNVAAIGIGAAHRVRYSGPMVTIRTASGKRLTVTPNHGMLTSNGFVRSRFIQNGDYLVGARRTDLDVLLATHGYPEIDFDHGPSAVENIFSALGVRGSLASIRKIMPSAVDLHGDEHFIDGDVDVISTYRSLQREHDASLREPYGQNQFRTTRELKRRLVGLGSAIKAGLGSLLAPYGNVGSGGYAAALCYAQAGIPQSEGLSLRSEDSSRSLDRLFKIPSGKAKFFADLRQQFSGSIERDGGIGAISIFPSGMSVGNLAVCAPEFKAGVVHPSSDGGVTDPHIYGDLAEAFPGFVELDRVVGVDVQRNVGAHVYDLSTDARWYVANGIITHNCVFAGAAHETKMLAGLGGKQTWFPDSAILKDYSAVTGFDPHAHLNANGENPTDNGTDMQVAAKYRQNVGILDGHGNRHKIAAYLAIDAGNLEQHLIALFLFGAVGIGIEVPSYAPDEFDAGKPWDVHTGRVKIVGGHYAPTLYWDGTNLEVITWARTQKMTPGFLGKFNDESVVYLSTEAFTNRRSPEGFDYDTLLADLNEIRNMA